MNKSTIMMCSERKKQKIKFGEESDMPVKLSTTLDKIDKIENVQNRFLVKQYHKFMDSTGASERHQNNNLKVIHYYVNYLGKDIFLSRITNIQQRIDE